MSEDRLNALAMLSMEKNLIRDSANFNYFYYYFKIFIQVISFILNMFFKLTCLTKNKSAYTKKTREINLPNLNTIQ